MVIEDEYRTTTAPNKRAAHALFKDRCKSRGFGPASYTWFAIRINSKDHRQTTKDRDGRRIEYSKFGFDFRLWRDAPPHGDHNWDVGHIDHTQIDLVTRISDKEGLRAWLTTFWLTYPRRLVAYWLHFDPPSRVAAMAVIRICLQKFGRIPAWIVVDNGKEFLTYDFQLLIKTFGSGVKYRPPHHGRSGAILESAHHSLNCNLLHNLPGNTKIMKNVRGVTKVNLPHNLATLSLSDIDQKIGAYYAGAMDIVHPALLRTPNQAYEEGQCILGARAHMFRPYDDEVHVLTMPLVNKGTCRVQPQGVKVGYFYYGHAALQNLIGEDIRVRRDTFNIGHVYAEVTKDKWVECVSPHLADLADRTNAQLKLASEQIRATLTTVQQRRQVDMAMMVLPLLKTSPVIARQADLDGQSAALSKARVPPKLEPTKEPLPPAKRRIVGSSFKGKNYKRLPARGL